MSMRVGHIWRHEDESGVSGTGRVAEWVEYSDGEVVVHWLSHTPSTNHYRNMKQVESIHGHSGKTEIVIDWEEPKPAPEGEDEEVSEEVPEKDEDASEEKKSPRKSGAKKKVPAKKKGED